MKLASAAAAAAVPAAAIRQLPLQKCRAVPTSSSRLLSPPAAPSYPAYPPQQQPQQRQAPHPQHIAGHGAPSAPGGPARTQTRSVPLEAVVQDICNMGFERGQVLAVVSNLQAAGQSVDLNVILDRLTRGMH